MLKWAYEKPQVQRQNDNKITQKMVFISDWPQISSRTSNISHRIQRYLPHRAKVRHAIPKNLVEQRMTCMP